MSKLSEKVDICRILLNGKLRNLGGFHWFYKTNEDIVRSLRKLKIAEEVDNSKKICIISER